MKNQLKLEECFQFLGGIVLFTQLDFAWWVFPTLLLTPDIGMLGYLHNGRTGALTYNLFHNKALAIVAMIAGFLYGWDWVTLIGIILFSHSAMDRCLGYGLKYPDDFKHTHLGTIGK